MSRCAVSFASVLVIGSGCGGSVRSPSAEAPRLREGQGPFDGCSVELRVLDAERIRLGERMGACADLGAWLGEGAIDRACLESLVRAGDGARGCVSTWLAGPRSAVVPSAVARVDSTEAEAPCIATFTLRASGEVRLADSPAPLADLAALARGTCPGHEARALVVVDAGTTPDRVDEVVRALRRGGLDEVAVDLTAALAVDAEPAPAGP